MERKTRYAYFQRVAKEIRTIASNYFVALKKVNSKKRKRCLSDSSSGENIYQRHVRRVKSAYDQLDSLEQSFINNDFFYENYPEWWKKSFSKSSYYRLRRISMVHFLEAFQNEN